MAPSILELGSWDPSGGLPATALPPSLASPTDSRPRSPASSWHRPGGFSGDSLEALQGAGAGPGQQGNPRVWQHRQPQSWAGELHGDGLGAAGMNPTGSPSPMRGSPGQLGYGARLGSWGKAWVPWHGHMRRDARGSCCRWWERRAVVSTGSTAGRRGLLAARDPRSIRALCPARVCPGAPFTPRAPVRTNDMEKPTRTSSISAGCLSHEAACHHRCCRKGKEEPPQPLPMPLLTATLMQAGTVGRLPWETGPGPRLGPDACLDPCRQGGSSPARGRG